MTLKDEFMMPDFAEPHSDGVMIQRSTLDGWISILNTGLVIGSTNALTCAANVVKQEMENAEKSNIIAAHTDFERLEL